MRDFYPEFHYNCALCNNYSYMLHCTCSYREQTFRGISLLPANNCSLFSAELVVTNGTPSLVEADLHSTVGRSSTISQSYFTILTHAWRIVSWIVMVGVGGVKR